ncbi:MAG TPA: hypothetical protein VLF40_01635 [Candidatus Saccharimonadales bacterium]|nr:hypothetical protein [Candidatus Saccharimonadales bacterium]
MSDWSRKWFEEREAELAKEQQAALAASGQGGAGSGGDPVASPATESYGVFVQRARAEAGEFARQALAQTGLTVPPAKTETGDTQELERQRIEADRQATAERIAADKQATAKQIAADKLAALVREAVRERRAEGAPLGSEEQWQQLLKETGHIPAPEPTRPMDGRLQSAQGNQSSSHNPPAAETATQYSYDEEDEEARALAALARGSVADSRSNSDYQEALRAEIRQDVNARRIMAVARGRTCTAADIWNEYLKEGIRCQLREEGVDPWAAVKFKMLNEAMGGNPFNGFPDWMQQEDMPVLEH